MDVTASDGLPVPVVCVLDEPGIRRRGRMEPVGGPVRGGLLRQLVIHRGQFVAWAALVDRVWLDEPPGHAVGQLRRAARDLAGRLDGTGVRLVEQSSALRLDGPPHTSDLDLFRSGVRAGRDALDRGEAGPATRHLRQALDRWPTGSPVPGLPGADRASLVEERAGVVEDLARAALGAGTPGAALPDLSSLCAAQPLRESAAALAVRVLAAVGRAGCARDAYRRTGARLAEDLGLDPGPVLLDAHRLVETVGPVPAGDHPATVVVHDAGWVAPPGPAHDDRGPRTVHLVDGVVLSLFAGPRRREESLAFVAARAGGPGRSAVRAVLVSDDVRVPVHAGSGIDAWGSGLGRARRLFRSLGVGHVMACESTLAGAGGRVPVSCPSGHRGFRRIAVDAAAG